MSVSTGGGIGRYIGKINQKADERDKEFKDFGFKVDSDRMVMYRLDAQWRLELELLDESIDIEDRVNIVDEEIEMVHKAWGRGFSNPEWTIRYNAWRKLTMWWSGYVLQRSQTMKQTVMIEQVMNIPLPDNPDNAVKVIRTVKKKTAESLQKRLGAAKFKIIPETNQEPPAAPEEWNSPFTETQVEQFVKKMGEGLMIQCGKVLSNWAWNEIDVTGKSIMVFHSPPQMVIPQSKPGIPESMSPDMNVRPEDKK